MAERGARGFSSDPGNQARDWVRHPMATLTTLVQHPSPGPSATETSGFLKAKTPPVGLVHCQVPQGPERGPAQTR